MLEEFLAGLVQLLRDRVAVFRLQREIDRLKLRNYDLLVDNLHGLRRALGTQRRAADELAAQLEQRSAQISELRKEYAALEARQNHMGASSVRDERLALFKRLQPVATQLPTLRAALADGANLSPRDVLDLLTPLDEMLRDLGFEQIGEAGTEVPYDPRKHRAVGRGARSIAPEAPVRVRYVGYVYDGEIVCKAEVTLAQQSEAIS